MTTRTRTLAVLTAGVLTLGLTACGGDEDGENQAGTTRLTPTLNADSGESPITEAATFGGFDTMKEQSAATTAYACHLMDTEDAAIVYKTAYDTITDYEVFALTFGATTPKEKAPFVGKVNMAANGVLEATCDEDSPYYETWVKAGYAQYVQDRVQPSREEIEESGALDTEQYARELSGEARSIANP